MTKELIERLYASDVASALTNEAARAIEALQARVADQSAQLTRHTNLIDQLQEERCKLAAELAAALPYDPRPKFGAIGSRDVDVAEAQRAWDKAMAAQPAQVPAGSIRLWDTQWASIVNHDNAYNGWSTNDAVNHAVRMTERYISANVAQNNLPPLPAAQEGSRDVDVAEAQRAWDKAMAAQPAQVPAWQPIESGFPATGIPVLADIGEKYPIRACWIAKFTQEIGASDFEGDDDYDEATDTAYWPEGWYEWNRFDETHWLVDKPVKNWALLPAAPEVK